MAIFLCDDGNAEIEIEADSAQDAAQEYVDGGDWGQITETIWINVHVWQREDCSTCDGDGETRVWGTFCNECHAGYAATGILTDNDYQCSNPDCIGPEMFAEEMEECSDCSGTGETDTERESITIDVDPDAPECSESEHDWQSPFSVLGGCEENPGVWGHGGSVIIRSVCAHCGVYRVTDGWAQNRETGEQGLESVTYEHADSDSLAWVAGKNAPAR